MKKKQITNKAENASNIMSIIIIFLIGIITGLLISEIKNNYFNNDNNSNKDIAYEFTKTYTIENILDSEEENSYYVTLKLFQGEVDTVLIPTKEDLIEGKTYEFTFTTTEMDIEDNIDSIFKNSNLLKIKETDKQGLAQIQEFIK